MVNNKRKRNDVKFVQNKRVCKNKDYYAKIIQKIYKTRYNKKVRAAVYIQKMYRGEKTREAFHYAFVLIRRHKVEFLEDPITCEPIENPVIIEKDWESRSFQIYNNETVENLRIEPKQEIIYDDNGMQIGTTTLYVDKRKGSIYRSPFTRMYFRKKHITKIGKELYFQIGKVIQKNVEKLKELEEEEEEEVDFKKPTKEEIMKLVIYGPT